jgi:deoxyribonuclease IV
VARSVTKRPKKRPAVLLGAHVSIAGGTHNAPPRAKAIDATALQIFTKQANRWAERECLHEECTAFRAALAETDVRAANAHDSYLINLASPDPALRTRSLESFVAELKRCAALGLGALVSHPGNYMDERASGIARNAESIIAALEQVPGETMLLMELTAGSGTALGSRFEDMAALLDSIPAPLRERVGVCLDTAHVWAAGYDIASDYDGVWAEFGDVIGIERLRLIHLNDSKAPLGSHRDRHELIGEGAIGEGAFRRIMNDPRFVGVPKVIETPKLDDPEATDRRMLDLLRSYIE